MVIHKPTDRSRSGIEIGAAITALIFMLGLSFQAGIQYGETQNLKSAAATDKIEIAKMAERSETLDSRMSRVEQLLADIRDTLQARGYKQ